MGLKWVEDGSNVESRHVNACTRVCITHLDASMHRHIWTHMSMCVSLEKVRTEEEERLCRMQGLLYGNVLQVIWLFCFALLCFALLCFALLCFCFPVCCKVRGHWSFCGVLCLLGNWNFPSAAHTPAQPRLKAGGVWPLCEVYCSERLSWQPILWPLYRSLLSHPGAELCKVDEVKSVSDATF